MSCERLHRALLEDAPLTTELRSHAARCPACAELLEQTERLAELVQQWRARTAPAPASLEAKVRAALEGASGGTVPRHRWIAPPSWRLAAAAAVIVFVLALVLVDRAGVRWREPQVVSTGGGLLVAEALREAQRAEAAHAAAIARLTLLVDPILARADDPATTAREAARLLAYRHRLAALDDAIARVRGFLGDNPGHPVARTTLLAAFIDKSNLLGEILTREQTPENG